MKIGDIFTIGISQADINAANIAKANMESRSLTCPISQSLRRKLKCRVTTASRTFYPNNSIGGFKLPESLKKFITNFDTNKPVKPMTVRFKLQQA